MVFVFLCKYLNFAVDKTVGTGPTTNANCNNSTPTSYLQYGTNRTFQPMPGFALPNTEQYLLNH